MNTKPEKISDNYSKYPTEKSKKMSSYAMFRCSCGKEFECAVSSIRSGSTSSCGCYRKKVTSARSKTHGMSKHPLYAVWCSLLGRISNTTNSDYHRYGGRGISVCSEWRSSFSAFYEWAISSGYEDGLTIDRIDNDGNYEPSNCRITDRIIQAQNTRLLRRNNKSGYRGVSIKGKKYCSNICVNRKTKYLGTFDSATDAAIAYNSYVIEHELEHPLNTIKENN